VLLDLVGWAMDTFAAHTANVTGMTLPSPVGQTITLPDNIVGNFETTGLVYLRSSDDTITRVSSAALLSYEDTEENTFTVWGNTLELYSEPASTDTLTLRYFSLYDHPTADNSIIGIPAWAHNAVAHLVGALALTSQAVQSAGIDRWKDKKDAGNPEDNALRIQQQHLMRFYNEELLRYPKQNRENYYQKFLS
jgi:hypothetical protein